MNEEVTQTLESPKDNKLTIKIISVIVLLVLVGLLIFSYMKPKSNEIVSASNSKNNKIISSAEISSHNNKESCWTTINGGVYDITNFISQHKGGDRILNACGTDATDLFTGKSPLGRVHSQVAVKLLSSMQIGILQK